MAVFKFVISDPQTRKSYKKELDQSQAAGIIGKKIGEEVSGDIFGLSGYTLKITGGTDKDGFPMHPSVKGSGKKRVLLAGPPAFHPKIKGQRKRKTIRGSTLSQDIVQVNIKIVKAGEKKIEEILLPKPKEEPAKETKEEAKKEIKPAEEKKPEAKPPEKKEEKPAKSPEETEEKKEVTEAETKPEKEEVKPPEKKEKKESGGGTTNRKK